jgi:hypothetical protein
MNMTPTCNDGTPNRVFGLPLALLALFAWSLALQGAYLWSVPVTVSQPDGEVLHLLATGDEYYNWVHDKDNYTIVRDPNTGVVEYARVESGKLAPSGYRVGTVKPDAVGLQPGANVFPDRQELPQGSPRGEPEPAYPAPTSGTINNLVVFIRFSGESEFTDAVSLYDTQFNTSVSSMNQYFQEASYGALATSTTFYPLPSGSTVVSYQDSQPRAYYQPYDEATNPIGYTGGGNGADRTAREHTLLVNAVNAVSGSVPAGLNLDGDGDGRVDRMEHVVVAAHVESLLADSLDQRQASLHLQLPASDIGRYRRAVPRDGALARRTRSLSLLCQDDRPHRSMGRDVRGPIATTTHERIYEVRVFPLDYLDPRDHAGRGHVHAESAHLIDRPELQDRFKQLPDGVLRRRVPTQGRNLREFHPRIGAPRLPYQHGGQWKCERPTG